MSTWSEEGMEPMDEMEFLVRETFRLNRRPRREVPTGPGLLYHLQAQPGVFVVRALAVDDLPAAYAHALASPEEFPSLRLLADGGEPEDRLRAFPFATRAQAEHVRERVGQRRFPRREEDVCNLSDPGFSWWIGEERDGFTLHGKMHGPGGELTRLGPLADGNVFPARWRGLEKLLATLPTGVDMTTEIHRFSLRAPGASWLAAELRAVFTDGEVSSELRDLFAIFAKRGSPPSELETAWFFLQEAAAVRRFWRAVTAEL